jgi:hypothetical protein
MQPRRSARSWISASTNTKTQKRESEARKKQKIIEIKEIKFRPNTDKHDYEVKMRSVFKFLGGRRQGKDHPAFPWPRDGAPELACAARNQGFCKIILRRFAQLWQISKIFAAMQHKALAIYV